MYDMVQNLKYDTIRYNRNLQANILKSRQLDTFRAEISKAIKGNIDGNRLYEFWLKSQDFNQVVFDRSAITQLKNSGSLRLIKSDSLVRVMIDYYERKITSCESAENGLRIIAERLDVSCLQFFYYEPFDELIKTETQYGKTVPDSVFEKNNKPLYSNSPLALLNSDPRALMLLYNEVAAKEKAIKYYNSFIRWAKEAAESLMIHIEDEYHFKN